MQLSNQTHGWQKKTLIVIFKINIIFSRMIFIQNCHLKKIIVFTEFTELLNNNSLLNKRVKKNSWRRSRFYIEWHICFGVSFTFISISTRFHPLETNIPKYKLWHSLYIFFPFTNLFLSKIFYILISRLPIYLNKDLDSQMVNP